MLILFGTRRSSQNLGRLVHACGHCRQQSWFTYARTKSYFTLFFVPVIPLGSTTVATCVSCGSRQAVSNAAADQALAWANRAPQPAQFAARP